MSAFPVLTDASLPLIPAEVALPFPDDFRIIMARTAGRPDARPSRESTESTGLLDIYFIFRPKDLFPRRSRR